MALKLNLGCPYHCNEYQCVDLHPKDSDVIKGEAIIFLATKSNMYDEIYSKNLFEHLTNTGSFLAYAYNALKKDGKIILITDNAEWLPFYLPFWINHTGIGAHSKDEYAQDKSHNSSHHYAIFTKMHLINLLKHYDFKNIKIKRIMLGSRLKVTAIK